MFKKLMLTCFVTVWAFIPPAKSELTINIYERDPNAEPLVQISAEEINSIPDEIDQLYKNSEAMNAYIIDLEKQIALIESDISNIDSQVNNGIEYNNQDLEKFASSKVDISEKETYEGIVYDIDIYDHSKKLNVPSWEEFKAKFNI